MKITAALIVRDAEPTLEACLDSLRPHVDEIVVVDTGSTDASPEIAKAKADTWERYTGCNVNPMTGQEEDRIWDFSNARNRSFELATGDWVFWADADDIVLGAETLRPAAEAAPPGPFAFLAPYEYSYDDGGRPTCIHWRERLIRNPKGMVWMTPCHEVCVPRAGGMAHDTLATVLIKHRAQEAASLPGAKPREPGRNLRILTAYLKRVGEGDPRAMYYCGVEYARHKLYGKAREMLRRYVAISGWTDERCLAELELGRIYFQEGDCDEAVRWAASALMTKSWPDPYWLLSKTFFRMGVEGADKDEQYNLRRSASWAERGRPLEDAQTVLFYNPTERFETERHIARIHAAFGDMDGAAESCRRGLKGLTGDPDLMEQLGAYESVRIGREMDTLLARLVHLGRLEPRVQDAVKALVSGELQLPPVAANDTGVIQGPTVGSGTPVDEGALPPVPEGKLDIVIFTGPAYEQWTPKTIEETGIGGSETMAWEMARHLARLGHRVRHYGMCTPEQEGVYEGVHWFDATRYVGVTCDALVISRYPDALSCPGIMAKAKLLWVHDVHVGPALTMERALEFDTILCLSNWHKEYFCSVYPFLDPRRVTVTRNGIDLSLFEQSSPAERMQLVVDLATGDPENEIPPLIDNDTAVKLLSAPTRNPHRAVYSSSPDRGLQTALELWPLIRKEVPDAELHVFYGFDNLRRGRPSDVALADKLEATAKATEGVFLRGRVSPKELAREFLKSGVWFYPTWFSETSCITAMQAQAAGLDIITSPIAALKETVGIGMLIPGAPEPIDMATRGFELAEPSDEYRRRAVAHVIAAMEQHGDAGRNDGSRFSLDTLALEWDTMLNALVANRPLPPFYCDPAMAAEARRADEEEAA